VRVRSVREGGERRGSGYAKDTASV
jgi:hypothetical protein